MRSRRFIPAFLVCLILFGVFLFSVHAERGRLKEPVLALSADPVIVALMYHHFTVNKAEQNSVTVLRDTFARQLKALKADGFVSITQQELSAFMMGGRTKLPRKSVIITIDDGYESNYKLAYPLLKQEKIHASIFAVTSFRGQTPSRFPHLTWEQAKEMYESGFVDIQNHTHSLHYYGTTPNEGKPALSHRILVNDKLESTLAYEKRIYDDLKTAKSLIEEHVGNPVIALSFPYGSYNDIVIRKSADAGHSLMYTIKEGVIRKGSDPHKLPRINVDGKYSAKELMKRIHTLMG